MSRHAVPLVDACFFASSDGTHDGYSCALFAACRMGVIFLLANTWSSRSAASSILVAVIPKVVLSDFINISHCCVHDFGLRAALSPLELIQSSKSSECHDARAFSPWPASLSDHLVPKSDSASKARLRDHEDEGNKWLEIERRWRQSMYTTSVGHWT